MKKIVPHKSSKIASRIVDKEAVVVILENQHTLVLNETGTRIWEMLDGKKSLSEIAQDISAEFDVTPDAALDDCRRFIADLTDKNAVTLEENE